ncbi:DUF1028 domain-containing protein [Oceanibacterium hippocampi]|uniref:DUF1028 domain-containing protein n=1 Tax=Oceanibacterium hippocampi TaxID=745714 RepID=A0A1Y5TKV3_9PROT|nr:DUF1028 domain-containing protein [Oceanibacterium hippocampi]SLN64401.1 hypothetical protein OCH7691_02916 [Oceanibacterium hippocampi]
MTFSIAARCPDTGMLGVAVTSSSICVASRCAFARAGVGAALSQNVTDPRLGRRALDMLEDGVGAGAAMQALVASSGHGEWRQLALVDAKGETAHFTGGKALGLSASAEGPGCVSVGNLLSNDGVPGAIVAGFLASKGHLGARLIAGLRAGLAAGGEESPVRSAGVMVADRARWPIADLRVDWDDDPLGRIAANWTEYEPQIEAYLVRALDPDRAESFTAADAR